MRDGKEDGMVRGESEMLKERTKVRSLRGGRGTDSNVKEERKREGGEREGGSLDNE